MRCSIVESLGDCGFEFLEKLHHPMFLLHRNGTIKKINEAGRKLVSIGHISKVQLEGFAREFIKSWPAGQRTRRNAPMTFDRAAWRLLRWEYRVETEFENRVSEPSILSKRRFDIGNKIRGAFDPN